MGTRRWKSLPRAAAFAFDGDALKAQWAHLHRGDREPFPKQAAAQEAWRHFHAGRFGEAVAAGVEAGGAGLAAANKAQAIYANALEGNAAAQLAHFEDVMARAEAQAKQSPKAVNAHYLFAYAAGRYSQRISVAKALAQGYGGRIRAALERTLALQPRHAEAHVALGAWHAEIIDKVGAMVGGLTYGARKDAAERHFREALRLDPASAIARVEMARGLLLLHGKAARAEAGRLLEEAAAIEPRDAMEWLDVESARKQSR